MVGTPQWYAEGTLAFSQDNRSLIHPNRLTRVGLNRLKSGDENKRRVSKNHKERCIRSYAKARSRAGLSGANGPSPTVCQDGSILAEIEECCLVRGDGIEPSPPCGRRISVIRQVMLI